jgi:inhibitor of cysteine peptidase
MKYWIIVFCLALVIPALSISCASSTAVPGISLSCDDFQKQANIVKDTQMKIGQTLTISLCSNRTTGFSWPEKALIGDPQVVEQAGYKWVPPQDKGKVGVPGTEVYTFKALQQGTSMISFGYSRPWQGGEQNVNTFKLNLTVK